MAFDKITEQPSPYRHLEKMPVEELLQHINAEDQTVAIAVKKVLPQVALLAEAIAARMRAGGRLFYIGAGTSGRLGVLDASECPPTYGVPEGLVTGVMAGGDAALRYGIEDAEDNPDQGWPDLEQYGISAADSVIGIAASGTTPYVVGALRESRKRAILTGCIVCNPGSPVAAQADHPIEVIVGPEFVTGSTRMKSGTAQKMILNMISTTVMIRLGRVLDNRMLHMQLSNEKLLDRGARMLMEQSGTVDYTTARALLLQYGSVQAALENL
ncbi:MAG: N-acetylmuramic acid 6-phosphate etherase [Candidatus Pseudobacter hemicellulosilyticus]|uniref:N-acetylmuramic acid 6-phosphate etherase n=1 Tax=Candidatus Pseudobacter hemicellulosilyticus TaxID=3121375 RepID=A0AAJ5WN45_9BACT|nr:MAG: N-acetylmuramic acid 6-phosphate etherase [Pseudobacter sp.]